jgi:hypothetical protein
MEPKKIDFQKFRKREKAGWGNLIRTLVYLVGIGVIVFLILYRLQRWFPGDAPSGSEPTIIEQPKAES